MGAVSVFITGNYLRQPVDDGGPLSLRWWSQLRFPCRAVCFIVSCDVGGRKIYLTSLYFHGDENKAKKDGRKCLKNTKKINAPFRDTLCSWNANFLHTLG